MLSGLNVESHSHEQPAG